MFRKKHDIVAKDWVVADIIIQFCKQFGWWTYRERSITIEYSGGPEIIKANVRIVGLDERIELLLRKIGSHWEVFREFNIFADTPFRLKELHREYMTEVYLEVKYYDLGDYTFKLSKYKLADGPYASLN